MATKPKTKLVSPDKAILKAQQIETIIDGLANGITLRDLTRMDNMPCWKTVYDWMHTNAELATRIAHAREVGYDAIAQECLSIANQTLEGVETEETDDGKVKIKRADMLGHRKLQIETRLKLLAKWSPKTYGDKLDLNHGGQPDNPITVVETVIVQHELPTLPKK